jgi:hypothetical protein
MLLAHGSWICLAVPVAPEAPVMSDCACGFDDVDNVSFGSLPQAGPVAPSYNTLALKTVALAAHPGGPKTQPCPVSAGERALYSCTLYGSSVDTSSSYCTSTRQPLSTILRCAYSCILSTVICNCI